MYGWILEAILVILGIVFKWPLLLTLSGAIQIWADIYNFRNLPIFNFNQNVIGWIILQYIVGLFIGFTIFGLLSLIVFIYMNRKIALAKT